MFRYDNVPEVPLVAELTVPAREPELWLGRTLVKAAALELGCNEVYNYSFVADAVLEACRATSLPHVMVRNPVAPEMRRVRRDVVPSLLASLAGNRHLQEEVRLMELGKGYHPETRGESDLPAEVFELAFAWSRPSGAHPYGELRTGVESLLARIGRPCVLRHLVDPLSHPFLHPARSAAITAGSLQLGYVGWLHPEVAARFELPGTSAVACLDLRAILTAGREDRRMEAIPRFPSQPVDVALVVPVATAVADVAAFLREAGRPLVRDVRLFEVYRGDRVPAGTKSLNFTVVLGAADRTLTAEDEAAFLGRVRERAADIGAELRG